MKAFVLSSGGVDSTTCIALAAEKYGAENVFGVSVFYGQKHKKELEAARLIAEHYGIKRFGLDLSEAFRFSDSSLLASSGKAIPKTGYAEQTKKNKAGVPTDVPFRNGLMLSAAASLAASLTDDSAELWIGAHADDAAGLAYADCGEDFMRAMKSAVSIGTYGRITVVSPFVAMNKAAVVREGLRLGVPYRLTWSCYEGGERPCGSCATCRDRAAAFAANKASDPALE